MHLLPKLKSAERVSPRHANKALKIERNEKKDVSIIYVTVTEDTNWA